MRLEIETDGINAVGNRQINCSFECTIASGQSFNCTITSSNLVSFYSHSIMSFILSKLRSKGLLNVALIRLQLCCANVIK